MGRAKRKQMPQAVAAMGVDVAASRVDTETALDERAVVAILEAVYGDGDGDPTVGITYAVVAGTALWAIIAWIVVLLI
jgi:glutamate mutase epsilon subunit